MPPDRPLDPVELVGRLRAIGVPLPEIALVPFPVLAKIWHEWMRIERARAGQEEPWDPDSVPDTANPDGSANEGLFFAYGVTLGGDPDWVREEYKRQKATNGFQSLPWRFMTEDEKARARAEGRPELDIVLSESGNVPDGSHKDPSNGSAEPTEGGGEPARVSEKAKPQEWVNNRGQLVKRRARRTTERPPEQGRPAE